MNSETYSDARKRLYKELSAILPNASKDTLKVLWVETNGHKIEFHKHAVYLDGHSLFLDIRGMTGEKLLEHCNWCLRGVNNEDD